jgi:hypothetical protein
MSSYSEEGHEWNTLANPIRHTLSILKIWHEKCLDNPRKDYNLEELIN